MRTLARTVAMMAMTGCFFGGGDGGTEDSGTAPGPGPDGGDPTTETSRATLTIEGPDIDTMQTVTESFDADIAVAAATYSEDEQGTTVFLGIVHTAGSGTSTEFAEIDLELYFPLLREAPPNGTLELDSPQGSQMLAGYTVTTDGAFDGRVLLENLEVTSSSVALSSFDVVSTSGQCLDADAQGPCETAVGTVFIDAVIVGEDGMGGRAELDLEGPVNGFWSRLTN